MKLRKRKWPKLVLGLLCILMTMVGAFCLCAVHWLFKTWNHLTMDELLFHINAPLKGTNSSMIAHFVKSCVVPAVGIALVVLVILVLTAVVKSSFYYRILIILMIASVFGTGVAVYQLWNGLDFTSYISSQSQYSTLIDDHYVDPDEVELKFPEKKRNLVYIYLESMETTFSDTNDGGAFSDDYIPELTALAEQNEDFSGEDSCLNGANELPGTCFTMGSIFGQTTGLPIKTSFDVNLTEEDVDFFPNVTNLGDILKEEGYQQVFILGSEASFAAKNTYFTEHGDFEIIDYNNALEQKMLPEGYKVWWGYEDQRAFAFAKEKMMELSKGSDPFNITILTVDTHFEDGYVCSLCEDEWGDNQYANVLSCSSRQIQNLLEWMEKQDFYDNTTVVLVGDHLTMDTDFCEEIPENYDRHSYTAFINAAADTETLQKREYSVLDFFPTTLAALGVEIEGNRLGLGTNLYSYEQTMIERFGLETVQTELEKKSKFMESMEQ